MNKLPIGIQSFEEIRSEDYYYVDKTRFIEKLVCEGKYYFLSRPRRFGKSLFLDTLRQAFLGKRELFKGLYLYDHWDWSKSYPVIYIDFAEGVIDSKDALSKTIESILRRHGKSYGIIYEEELLNLRFRELIEKVSEKYESKVVVLIDEYDKPILDRIEDKEAAIEIREVLKNFYGVLKPLDAYLKFVFITGVSKFSKVSLFSGLNQLQDITLNPRYGSICGYTQGEFEEVFSERLSGVDLEKVRCWYDGYSWLGEKVYNPFDILLYLAEGEFRPYWFETGTPTFLIKLMFENRFYLPEVETLDAGEKLIGSFDIDEIYPENLMFQTGYLTIAGKEWRDTGALYFLKFPNKEVRVSFNDHLLSYYTKAPRQVERNKGFLKEAVAKNDFDSVRKIFHSFFSSIPHDWYRRNDIGGYEGYYASVVYAYFCASGFDVVVEDATSAGKIDMTVFYGDKVYIMEFKVVELEGGKALSQLKEKKYWEKYADGSRKIYLLGIEFSRESRNIVGSDVEEV
ncbi:MAG: AAA family ATPase [Thermodesulforhabdaceae bacterium]